MGELLKVGPAVFCLAVSRTKTCSVKQRGFARPAQSLGALALHAKVGFCWVRASRGCCGASTLCAHTAPDLPGQEKRPQPHSTPRSSTEVFQWMGVSLTP